MVFLYIFVEFTKLIATENAKSTELMNQRSQKDKNNIKKIIAKL